MGHLKTPHVLFYRHTIRDKQLEESYPKSLFFFDPCIPWKLSMIAFLYLLSRYARHQLNVKHNVQLDPSDVMNLFRECQVWETCYVSTLLILSWWLQIPILAKIQSSSNVSKSLDVPTETGIFLSFLKKKKADTSYQKWHTEGMVLDP